MIVFIGLTLMILERIIPDQKLPLVKGWWLRVIIINSIQLGIVFLGATTWEIWLQKHSFFDLANHMNSFTGALLAYFIITFVFYWWHKLRHDINFLWLLCHQVHHSPSRIETITSFYKHPIEIIMNSFLISGIVYTLLGLDFQAGAWVVFITAIAEFFYHMNIKTPRWAGYFIQRPEMHRIHHQRSKHYNNFSDLPVWDMIFGTYDNPKTYQGACGFQPERELQFLKMLFFKNVNRETKK